MHSKSKKMSISQWIIRQLGLLGATIMLLLKLKQKSIKLNNKISHITNFGSCTSQFEEIKTYLSFTYSNELL